MKKIYAIVILITANIIVFAGILDEDGKAGRTGSPNEFDCTGCHTSFAVNSGPGSISISSPNLVNWQYIPGQVYQIDVTVAHTGVPLFGFGFEALRTTNNTNGGTLSISNSLQTQLKNANINGSNRTNVVHKENGGLTNDLHTFSFNWTAPATNIGNIMFYTAGNAADNQGDSLNDYVYKTSQLVTPFVSGINETELGYDLTVYPNPASTELTISALQKIEKLELVDLKGKVVWRREFNLPVASLNVSGLNLKDGLYFLNYGTDAGKTGSAKILFLKKD